MLWLQGQDWVMIQWERPICWSSSQLEKKGMSFMPHIVVLKQGGNRKAYCGDCADAEPLVQAELEKYEDEGIEVSDRQEDVLGEECCVCHRLISHLKAEPRTYQVIASFTIDCEIELRAASATQAQFLVTEALADKFPYNSLDAQLKKQIDQAIGVELSECSYEVESVKVLPPDLSKYREG
jgi:hypothetical protein